MKFKGFAFSAALFLACITSFAEDFYEMGGVYLTACLSSLMK